MQFNLLLFIKDKKEVMPLGWDNYTTTLLLIINQIGGYIYEKRILGNMLGVK